MCDVCATVLIAAGMIAGKRCTAYTALEPDVVCAGGKWDKDCPVDGAVVDGNLVTGVAWPGMFLKLREGIMRREHCCI